jgi:hypothetical protein
MRRSAKFTLLDQAARGDWARFINDNFPREQEDWLFEHHNFLQLICVKKAPLKVFEKYVPRMKHLINVPLYENGNTPLHLLIGKDYFYFPGNPEYSINDQEMAKIIGLLIRNGADKTIKNNSNKTPFYEYTKLTKRDTNCFNLLYIDDMNNIEEIPTPRSFVGLLFSCCFDCCDIENC